MLSGESVARAFDQLDSLVPRERWFIQHVLMQALAHTDLVSQPLLVEHLPLTSLVLHSIPLSREQIASLPKSVELATWVRAAVPAIVQPIAASTPGIDAGLLGRLTQIALCDLPAVVSFLEGAEAQPFIEEPATEIDLPDLIERRALEVVSGVPLLSEGTTENGAIYLTWRCGEKAGEHHELWVRSERRAIAEYMACRMPTRDVLTRPNDNAGFLVTESPGEPRAVRLVAVSSLPETWLPAADVLHEPDLEPDGGETAQTFLVSEWNSYLFYELERLYLNVFAFTYFVADEGSTGVPTEVRAYDLNGYAYGKMYDLLRHRVPANENAHASSVAAASPGVLTISAPYSTAHHVLVALRAAAEPEAAAAYRRVHVWAKKTKKDANIPKSAESDVQQLCAILQVEASRILPDDPDDDERLGAGKLIASYFRQLARLHHPDKRAEFLMPGIATSNESLVEIAAEDDE